MEEKYLIKCFPHEEDYAMWLLKRISFYGIVWVKETGEIVIKDSDDKYKTMNRNHLKSILRNDFKSFHGNLPRLNSLVEETIKYCECKAKFGDDVGVDIAIVGKLDA